MPEGASIPRQSFGFISHALIATIRSSMKAQSKVTGTGTTTTRKDLRKRAGNTMQRHIRARAGAWMGKISGVQLLKRTRS
jgi:hypothetical protein